MERIIAKFDGDSKRYHRFIINDKDQDIVGNIYFPKDGEKVPDEITVVLKTGKEGDKGTN